MEPQRAVIRPEAKVFAGFTEQKTEQISPSNNQSLQKMLATQPIRIYITEHVLYPDQGGMWMKYKGVPFYRQGFVFPEAMDNANNLKKLTVLFLAVIKGKGIKGRIGTFLAHYCWIADWMFMWYNPQIQRVQTIYLQENRYRQSVQELIKLINNFLDNLGIKVESSGTGKGNFGRVIGTMLEYDNAYHWRMEDIFSETTKEKLLENPRKEILRLLNIYKQRETQGIEFKAEAIEKIMKWILLIPSVKKAFRKAIESIDVEKLGMTHGSEGQVNDAYFTMNYGGYNFEGKSLEERQKIWLEMTGGKIPERVFIPSQ